MSLKPYDLPPNAEKVFEGEIFTLWQWKQELYDKSTAIFERITRQDAASAIGVLPDKKILMIEDEQPHRPMVITAPGGRLDPGENPKDGVKREFTEETGYEIGRLIPWFKHVVSSNVVFTVHSFIARDLKKIGKLNLDAGEKITIKTYSFEDFLNLAHNPILQDQAMRIKLLEAKLDKKKKKELYTLLYG